MGMQPAVIASTTAIPRCSKLAGSRFDLFCEIPVRCQKIFDFDKISFIAWGSASVKMVAGRRNLEIFSSRLRT